MNETKNEICPAEYLLLMMIHTQEGIRFDFLLGSKAGNHKQTFTYNLVD